MQITAEQKQAYLQQPQQFFDDLAARLGTTLDRLTVTGASNRVLEGTVGKGQSQKMRQELSGDPALFSQFLDTLEHPTEADGSRFIIAKTNQDESKEKVYILSPRSGVIDKVGFNFSNAAAISTATEATRTEAEIAAPEEAIPTAEPELPVIGGDGEFTDDDFLQNLDLDEVANEVIAGDGSFIDAPADEGFELPEEPISEEVAADPPAIAEPATAPTPDESPLTDNAASESPASVPYRIEQIPGLEPVERDWRQVPSEAPAPSPASSIAAAERVSDAIASASHLTPQTREDMQGPIDNGLLAQDRTQQRLPLEQNTVDAAEMDRRIQTVAPLLDNLTAHYGGSHEGKFFKVRRDGDTLTLTRRQGEELLTVQKQGEGYKAIGTPKLTETDTNYFNEAVAPVLERKQEQRLNRVLTTAGKLVGQTGKPIVTGKIFQTVWSPKEQTLSLFERGDDKPIAVGKRIDNNHFKNLGSRLTPQHEQSFAEIDARLEEQQQAWVQKAGEISVNYLDKNGLTEVSGKHFSANFDRQTGHLEIRERESNKQIVNARREQDGKFTDLGSRLNAGHMKMMEESQQKKEVKQQKVKETAPALVQ